MDKVIVKLSEPTSQYQQKILLDAGYKWSSIYMPNPVQPAKHLFIDVGTKEMSWSYSKHINDAITFEEFDRKYLNPENIGDNKETDKINPSHYKQYSRETIDTMQGASTPEEFKGYLKLNIIKYISRYQSKNGVEDLKKAQWYLNKLKEVVDNGK